MKKIAKEVGLSCNLTGSKYRVIGVFKFVVAVVVSIAEGVELGCN